MPGAKHANTYLHRKSIEYPGLQKDNIWDAVVTDFSKNVHLVFQSTWGFFSSPE